MFFFWGGGDSPPPPKKNQLLPPPKFLLTLFFTPRGPRLLPPKVLQLPPKGEILQEILPGPASSIISLQKFTSCRDPILPSRTVDEPEVKGQATSSRIESVLTPKIAEGAYSMLKQGQTKAKKYFDRGTRQLPQLNAGDASQIW